LSRLTRIILFFIRENPFALANLRNLRSIVKVGERLPNQNRFSQQAPKKVMAPSYAYPAAGSTIGPAMRIGQVAANYLANGRIRGPGCLPAAKSGLTSGLTRNKSWSWPRVGSRHSPSLAVEIAYI